MRNKQTKTILWGFLTTDYKAMIEQLEDMAKRGWILEKIAGFTAKFRSIPPQNLKYYVDIFPGSGVFDSAENAQLVEYRKLCEESGWNFITSKGYLQFFCSAPDAQPIPIQTDREIEEKIINRTILRMEYFGIILFFIIAIYNLFKVKNYDYQQLLSFTGVAAAYVFPLAIVPMFVWAVYMVVWKTRLRKYVKNGEPMPVPSLRSAKVRAWSFYIIILAIIISMVLSFIGDALTGSAFILIALFPPLVGAVIGFLLKKYFKASADDKTTKITVLIVALVAAVILTPLITMITFMGVASRGFEEVESVPQGYNVLKLEDFPLYEPADLKIQRFDSKVSPLVPKYFEYWELDENKLSISSEYFRGLTPYFAKKIFRGKLAEETRHKKAIPASTTEWQVDEVYYLGDTHRVLFRKDNVVGYIDGDFDLSNTKIRELVINKLTQND